MFYQEVTAEQRQLRIKATIDEANAELAVRVMKWHAVAGGYRKPDGTIIRCDDFNPLDKIGDAVQVLESRHAQIDTCEFGPIGQDRYRVVATTPHLIVEVEALTLARAITVAVACVHGVYVGDLAPKAYEYNLDGDEDEKDEYRGWDNSHKRTKLGEKKYDVAERWLTEGDGLRNATNGAYILLRTILHPDCIDDTFGVLDKAKPLNLKFNKTEDGCFHIEMSLNGVTVWAEGSSVQRAIIRGVAGAFKIENTLEY
jgi:hypothetical protein